MIILPVLTWVNVAQQQSYQRLPIWPASVGISTRA